MSVKNTMLGGTDWDAEDLYYQDLNDTFSRTIQAALCGLESRTPMARLPAFGRGIILGAGAQESLTNVTNDGDILHTTSTGAYSITFPAVILPSSKQVFGVHANGIVGSKITDVDISHTSTSATDIVSNVGLYKAISFGFSFSWDEGFGGSQSGQVRFTDGSTHATVLSSFTTGHEEQVRYDGVMNIYFGPSHDEAVVHYKYNVHREDKNGYAYRETAASIGPKEKWAFIDLSALSGTVDLELNSTIGHHPAAVEFQTYGAAGYSDNEFDSFVTISISTDEGSSWTAIEGNGVSASATASGSSIKVKLEGTASASDEYLLLRDVSIVPIS
jgi:hypothetical protein